MSFHKSNVPLKQNDCIEYQYDGIDTLILNHINAGFNCCPGKIIFNINITGNTITITEKETERSRLSIRQNCLERRSLYFTALEDTTAVSRHKGDRTAWRGRRLDKPELC